MANGIAGTFDTIDEPVWQEAEVLGNNAESCSGLDFRICLAMMSMQNKCLVEFLGAGIMSHPQYDLRVLFTVQVRAKGAIVLGFNCVLCVGVHVRRLIGSKDLGPAIEQRHVGREAPVV